MSNEQKRWSLHCCDQATGRDFLLRKGSEAEMRKEMRVAAIRGKDVWIIDPSGHKHLPDASVDETTITALDDKLAGIKHCIVKGYDEDAQNHIFDLLRGLRCKTIPDTELTREGLALKALWKSGSTT